jgi:hypothetical protein
MRVKILGLSLMMTCAIIGFTAGAAQAAGPLWWEAGNKELAANTSIEAFGNLTNFKFKTGADTLICKRASKAGVLGAVFKGNPGTDTVEIEYTECADEGQPNCVTKPIKQELLSLLAYPAAGANGGKAVDAFFPEKGNLMLKFTLENKSATETCVFNGTTVEFKAIGTEIEIPNIKQTRKCGTVAKLGIVEAGGFKETKGGEIGKKGSVRLPEPAITAAEYWNPTGAGKFEALTCKMEATVTEPCKVSVHVAEEIGDASFTLKEEKEIGWEV